MSSRNSIFCQGWLTGKNTETDYNCLNLENEEYL
jgi:hypothetical protein